MALAIGDKLIDAGLGYVSSNADKIYICSQQPTSYAEATSTYALGSASFGVGAVAGAPQAATGGRKVVTNPVPSGTVSSVGMPTYWAIVDSVNSLLLATGTMTDGVTTDIAKAWTLGAIGIALTGALSGPVYDTDTAAWAAAVVTAGGTASTARRGLMDNLIVGLKTDGVWAKCDRIWILAAENRISARVELKTRILCTEVNTPAFTIDRGYTGAAAASSVNTNYMIGTDTVLYTQDTAHGSIWNLTEGQSADACLYSYRGIVIFPELTDDKFQAGCNDYNPQANIPITDCRGLLATDRSGAFNYRTDFQNGGIILGPVGANSYPMDTPNNLQLYTRQFASASAGASLTATEHLALYNRLRTYMTAVGVP